MKRYAILAALLLAALPSQAAPKAEDAKETKEVQVQIQIINLLNNIELRDKQADFLLKKAREAKALRADAREKIASYKSKMRDALGKIREEVGDGKVVIQDDAQKTFKSMKGKIDETAGEAARGVDDIVSAVESNLEKYQLIALDDYKPCIIPRVAKGRIGQADTSANIVKLLEKVKDASDRRYAKVREKAADRIMEKIKRPLPGEKINEAGIREKILDTFDKVRKMDAAEFMMKKGDIANGLVDGVLPKKKEMTRHEKIEKLLLADEVIPVLEERMKKK